MARESRSRSMSRPPSQFPALRPLRILLRLREQIPERVRNSLPVRLRMEKH